MFVASKLPKLTTASGWVELLDRRTPTLPLQKAITVDIAIIGAGFAGLSAARRISQIDPTTTVALLEATIIGEGAAGRNSGFIIDLPHEVSSDDYGGNSLARSRQDIFLYRSAIDLAAGVAEDQQWGPEIFNPCGRYSVAMGSRGEEHIKAYAKQLTALGERHQILSATEISQITGTPAYTAGLFMPGTVIVQPAAYIRGVADSLRATVQVFEQTPALSFEVKNGSWLIKTPDGSVTAQKIILANNGYARDFGFFQKTLMPIFTYASMTEAFDPDLLSGQRQWAATPALPMGTTVRRIAGRDGDRILIRSRYTFSTKVQVSENAVNSAGKAHDKKFASRFPMLPKVRMQYRWGGEMAVTLNGVPAFGEVAPGVISACGCNGLGASKSTAAGIAAADFAMEKSTPILDIFNDYAPPKKLPAEPFLSIGASANLYMKELLAGRE